MNKNKQSKTQKFNDLNNLIAVKLTSLFGSMPIAYLFMLYGLIPLISIFSPYQDKFLYWSNWVQLWSLPVLAVGQNVMSKGSEKREKASEKRALETNKIVKESHQEQLEEIKLIKEMLNDIQDMIKRK